MTGGDFIWIFVYGAVWLALGYGCLLRANHLRRDGRMLQAILFWLLAAAMVGVVVAQVLMQTIWKESIFRT